MVRYLPPGTDFGPEHFPESFGFRASAAPMPVQPAARMGQQPMPARPMPMQQNPVVAPRPMATGGPTTMGMGSKPDNIGNPPTGMAKGGFIKAAIKRPGALHADLHVPQGEKIPAAKLAAAAKQPGKVGQRARFAETLKALSHRGKKG